MVVCRHFAGLLWESVQNKRSNAYEHGREIYSLVDLGQDSSESLYNSLYILKPQGGASKQDFTDVYVAVSRLLRATARYSSHFFRSLCSSEQLKSCLASRRYKPCFM